MPITEVTKKWLSRDLGCLTKQNESIFLYCSFIIIQILNHTLKSNQSLKCSFKIILTQNYCPVSGKRKTISFMLNRIP